MTRRQLGVGDIAARQQCDVCRVIDVVRIRYGADLLGSNTTVGGTG